MGIHGLSYFIRSFPSLVESKKWKLEQDRNLDHFIIDGNAFVYHIAFENRTSWTHGGQYATISNVIRNIVNVFIKAGIQLTFLFDGALPTDKIPTRIKRHRSYIERCANTIINLKQINAANKDENDRHNGIQYFGDLFLIPPLTLEVFIQTLKELNVQVIICPAEADGEVVKLAKEKQAYVISQDSDMYVYPNVGKGYISLDQLTLPSTVVEGTTQYITASVFHPEAFANLLNLSPTQLPLLGTLLGNDYLEANVIRPPISQWCNSEGVQVAKNNQLGWPKLAAELIKRNSQQGDIIKNIAHQLRPIILKSDTRSKQEIADELEDRIYNSISRYDTCSPLLNNKITTENDDPTIAKQSEKYSRQVLDVIESKTFWTSIFIEDVERECSWDVSRSLRQVLYGTITNKEDLWIDEYIRKKQHLEPFQVKAKVAEKSTNSFYEYHISKHENLVHLNEKLHPLVLCVRYMIYNCSKSIGQRLYDYEVVGMVVASLKSLSTVLGFSTKETVCDIPTLKKRAIHLSAQFQSVIYSSFLLSQVFDIPNYLQLPQVLSHLYNGTYFHHYIELARIGTSISGMLDDELKSTFSTVYKHILEQLENDIEHIFDYTNSIDNKPKRIILLSSKKPEKKKKKLSSNNNNAFSVLSFGCNFDD